MADRRAGRGVGIAGAVGVGGVVGVEGGVDIGWDSGGGVGGDVGACEVRFAAVFFSGGRGREAAAE